MAGSWTTLTNAPPAAVATLLLLTDGTVMAQGVSTNKWYRLKPDAHGSYTAGTWTTLADSVKAPLYYASGILRDGTMLMAGGEYDLGNKVWLLNVERYDPAADAWTTQPNPAGWTKIGDAPGCVLPDGRFFLGQVTTKKTAIYDPVAKTWTAGANKINSVGEESWSLLPDGTVHAVDCSNPPQAEKYVIASDSWVSAGSTPQTLVDSISEIGPSVLLPDGRLFVIGATGATALYTMPPVANQAGTWAQGPSIPQVNTNQPLGTVDGPAAVLPNGRVFFSASPRTSPASFQTPTFFFEYDPATNAISHVSEPTNSTLECYRGRLLVLPTGQVMFTSNQTTVSVYTPDGSPDPVWKPTITALPSSVRRGVATTLSGRQINGLNQGSYYGNDATNATNYPIVRLQSGSDVYYCRTTNFSTMGLQTGTAVHSCSFTVPSAVPLGSYQLTVIANGIASDSRSISVTVKRFKELKSEIKEKSELVENLKRIADTKQKRVVEIDFKINEELDMFREIEETWLRNVREVAEGLDATTAELSRSFIKTEERPFTGIPDPVVEQIEPRKISAAEAERAQQKVAFADGRLGVMSKEAHAFDEQIHKLYLSGGKEAAATDTKVTKVTKAVKSSGKTSSGKTKK